MSATRVKKLLANLPGILALVVAFGSVAYAGSWTPAPSPGYPSGSNNVDAPINVGASPQIKTGDLTTKDLSTGLLLANSGIAVGSASAPATGGISASGSIYSTDSPNYAQTDMHTWGLDSAGTMYLETGPGTNLYLTDNWSGTGQLHIGFSRTYLDKGGIEFPDGTVQTTAATVGVAVYSCPVDSDSISFYGQQYGATCSASTCVGQLTTSSTCTYYTVSGLSTTCNAQTVSCVLDGHLN